MRAANSGNNQISAKHISDEGALAHITPVTFQEARSHISVVFGLLVVSFVGDTASSSAHG